MMVHAKRRRAAIAGGAVLLVALAALGLPRWLAAAEPPPPPDRYLLSASGRIDAAGEARFLVAERDARIAQVHVRPGDMVAAGAKLISLACDDTGAELAMARAEAAAAAANARLVVAGPRQEAQIAADAQVIAAAARDRDARDLLHRAEALRASGFVSSRRLSGLDADVEARAAEVLAARAAADAIRNGARPDERAAAQATAMGAAANATAIAARLEKCTLRAPISGTVLKLLRREGEFSGSGTGTPLVVVGDMQRLIVRAEVADRDAADARLGMAADIWIDGQTQHWRGTVIEAAALMGRKTARSLDPSDRFDRDVREILVAFDGQPPAMPIGLRVNVGLLR
jgi:HlyD family secretion protein